MWLVDWLFSFVYGIFFFCGDLNAYKYFIANAENCKIDEFMTKAKRDAYSYTILNYMIFRHRY